MRRLRRVAFVAVFVLPLAGCGNSPAPAARPTAATTPVMATSPAGAEGPKGPARTTGTALASADAGGAAATPKYEAKGRRDPFTPLDVQEGVKGPSVGTAKLRGIVTGSSGPLALIDTAEGVGYIMKRGDTLVDGRLVDINHDSVVFAVASKPGAPAAANRITLRLLQD